jgi:hypothetical protein
MKALAPLFLVLFVPATVWAAPDAKEGARLVDAGKCESCHQDKVYGPAGSIYTRKDRRVHSWAKLKSQVAACNAELNLGLFPEEEEHVAAFLNARWYKLPEK